MVNSSESDPAQFSHDRQRCQVCGKGEECPLHMCSECTPCAPGHYKAAVSTEACDACPKDTYRETEGANELGDCEECLANSHTNGAMGQTSWSACVCDSAYYRIVADDKDDACMECPRGLICDGTSTVQPVVENSTWVVDGAIYKLQSCPSGYYVEASTDELQECKPCGKVTRLVGGKLGVRCGMQNVSPVKAHDNRNDGYHAAA